VEEWWRSGGGVVEEWWLPCNCKDDRQSFVAEYSPHEAEGPSDGRLD
jgi:hypothetical protein